MYTLKPVCAYSHDPKAFSADSATGLAASGPVDPMSIEIDNLLQKVQLPTHPTPFYLCVASGCILPSCYSFPFLSPMPARCSYFYHVCACSLSVYSLQAENDELRMLAERQQRVLQQLAELKKEIMAMRTELKLNANAPPAVQPSTPLKSKAQLKAEPINVGHGRCKAFATLQSFTFFLFLSHTAHLLARFRGQC